MNKKNFGERVRIARLRKNLRQVDVAIALQEYGIELNQTAIGKIERGERNLYVHELAAFVEVLDISADWVMNGGEIKIS